jgi:hypothetical protein
LLSAWGKLIIALPALLFATSCFARPVDQERGQAGTIAGTENNDRDSTDNSEIVVTGTLLRGLEPVGNEAVTLARARIEETGAATTAGHTRRHFLGAEERFALD